MLKNVISALEEDIDPKSIDVSHLELKDELNREIWDFDEASSEYFIKEDVRKQLLHIGEEFFLYVNSKLERLAILDVIFTGSMCNYNWSSYSDLDVHIIVDYSEISTDEDLVTDYLLDKYSIWKKNNHITVKGYDVECFAQDKNEQYKSFAGVYSLVKKTWLVKPSKIEIDIDFDKIQEKAAIIMNFIEKFHSDKKAMNDLAIKIRKARQSGLEKNGEFSNENLLFKVLRRNGTIKYLKSLLNF